MTRFVRLYVASGIGVILASAAWGALVFYVLGQPVIAGVGAAVVVLLVCVWPWI